MSEVDHFGSYLRLLLIGVFADFLNLCIKLFCIGDLSSYLIDVATLLYIYYNITKLYNN